MDKILEFAAMPEYKDSKRLQQLVKWYQAAKDTWGDNIINPVSGKKHPAKAISGDGTLTFDKSVRRIYEDVKRWRYENSTPKSNGRRVQEQKIDTVWIIRDQNPI